MSVTERERQKGEEMENRNERNVLPVFVFSVFENKNSQLNLDDRFVAVVVVALRFC